MKKRIAEIDISGQINQVNMGSALGTKVSKNKSKSGHQKMQVPIMLCLKAKGIHIAPPGNSYNLIKQQRYINFTIT